MGPEEFTKFDILAWWKGKESQFPVLAAMARDLLSVQASTMALESAFSTSGRVLSIRRKRLTPASLEMCIFLKDHLDEAERIQHISNLEDGLDYEEQLHDVDVETGFAISFFDEEIALDEAASEARSSEAEEEDLTLKEALN
uniref:Transposase n=1 Tax=Tanacetum cinerariifolium TaxID=118510 RepID=A0A6L2JN48_TANCI|nr:transposase [Tanacetum cinerariifolium]